MMMMMSTAQHSGSTARVATSSPRSDAGKSETPRPIPVMSFVSLLSRRCQTSLNADRNNNNNNNNNRNTHKKSNVSQRVHTATMRHYNRDQYLIDKFYGQPSTLQQHQQQQLDAHVRQLTHETILSMGEMSLNEREASTRKKATSDLTRMAKEDEAKREAAVKRAESELASHYERQLADERASLGADFAKQLARIEKQRDLVEQERHDDLMRKLKDECDRALRKQWLDAEALKSQQFQELRIVVRDEYRKEMEAVNALAIEEAVAKARTEFEENKRLEIEALQAEWERSTNARLKEMSQRYDAKIEMLTQKLKDTEERLALEHSTRLKLEHDFRLLQVDYKRFMNHTGHFNSDYLMKLRWIGAQLLDDDEYESKLDQHIENDVPHALSLPHAGGIVPVSLAHRRRLRYD